MNTIDLVRQAFVSPLGQLVESPAEYLSLIRATQDAKFGDYQANMAMPLAKTLKRKPRDVADEIVKTLPVGGDFESIDVAGPGFINIKLSKSFLQWRLTEQWKSPTVGITPIDATKTIVVDYSSPNVAKPMHVGHLRSTVIGDAIARTYRALGWRVLSDNHLGDWGTQFGMLIYGWRNLRDETLAQESPIQELARLYKLVNRMGEDDANLARACRDETAKLHEADADNLALWNQFMPWCLADLGKMYDRLGIAFDMQLGESFYQPMLADVVTSLTTKRLAEVSDGAICVFFPDPSGKVDEEGKPIALLPPTIIKKTDGAFTYATSDLACIKYRVEHFKPSVMVYVVDDRQSLHFQQLFSAARKWGFEKVGLVHVAFGKITGKDGKPYKTREGGTVGLESLLDEAVERARRVVDENSPELPESERAHVAEIVGIGAVKYADLSQNRQSDYVFDWDKMISLQGNTATYLQYVYARNRSIFRKGEIDPASLDPGQTEITLDHPSERALAIKLIQFGEAVTMSAEDYRPNVITSYLFDLANAYNGFFRDCRVLKAESEPLRKSRLILCEITARTIRQGLDLLGIKTVDRM
ncbi:arginine--tRNA ligase [bacterium]|nr:arginine--tRNA ligase [bacterium]